jgi:creatinine amidohydrolase
MTAARTTPDRPVAELHTVQAELLLPHEIAAALAARSVVYLPLGSIEFHSAHLPIGLDGLSAHGVCARAARAGGGIVLPTLYYGTGGGHTAYPWTIMASAGTIADLIRQSLQRLSDFGVRLVVLFTGHFADEQLAMIDTIANDWNGGAMSLRVLPLSVNRSDASVPPDHAGAFETSLLSAMWPDRVEIDRLPALADAPTVDPGGDVMGAHRHDPAHPLHGVFGPDPRVFDPTAAPALLDEIVAWTVRQVELAGSTP